MILTRAFSYLSIADFIVRSTYQMGKAPLLPIFAASLGSGEILIGLIVSASTLTGMIFKPFVGLMSDRWGQRTWLITGTIFFVTIPFLYRFIDNPEQLISIRLLHGMATAIYGPVTLSYIATMSWSNRAGRIGSFSIARNAGYIVGPLTAGWLLMSYDPVSVFTIIGLLSCIAFLPVLLLPRTTSNSPNNLSPVFKHAKDALRSGFKEPALWIAGLLDANINLGLYAAKAFVPIYALSIGMNIVHAGIFFSIQAAVNIIVSPIGGWISDRIGHMYTTSIGTTLLSISLIMLTISESIQILFSSALFFGIATAFVFPSTMALVSAKIPHIHLGAGIGLVGSLRNAGKVAGPLLAGLIIEFLDFTYTFRFLGIVMLAIGILIWLKAYIPQNISFATTILSTESRITNSQNISLKK